MGAKWTYFEERSDDGEDNNGKQGHDNAAYLLASPSRACFTDIFAYHVHAFPAETTGFTIVGDVKLRYYAEAGSSVDARAGVGDRSMGSDDQRADSRSREILRRSRAGVVDGGSVGVDEVPGLGVVISCRAPGRWAEWSVRDMHHSGCGYIDKVLADCIDQVDMYHRAS